jgi:hypothetical protein
MVWKSAPDAGFKSNAIACHHAQLKMAGRRQFSARWKNAGHQGQRLIMFKDIFKSIKRGP